MTSLAAPSLAAELFTPYSAESRLAASREIDALRGRTVCLVGCTGLIGGTLLRVFAAANRRDSHNIIQVIGVARRTDSLDVCAAEPGEWLCPLSLSVTDPGVAQAVRSADHVVYIAGSTSDYAARPTQTIETQTIGLENALSACRPGTGFVYVSSARVYGRAGGPGLRSEETPPQNGRLEADDLYDLTKRLGETLCRTHAARGCARVSILRAANLYGIGLSAPPETAITDFVRQAVDTRSIVLSGNPGSVRNWCSAADFAQGVIRALIHGSPGRAYNIGSDEHLSTVDVAEAVRDALPFASPVRFSVGDAGPSVIRLSTERARQELGYRPHCRFASDIPDVVRETLKHLRPHGEPKH